MVRGSVSILVPPGVPSESPSWFIPSHPSHQLLFHLQEVPSTQHLFLLLKHPHWLVYQLLGCQGAAACCLYNLRVFVLFLCFPSITTSNAFAARGNDLNSLWQEDQWITSLPIPLPIPLHCAMTLLGDTTNHRLAPVAQGDLSSSASSLHFQYQIDVFF